LVKVGEEIKENQIIASVVPVSSSFSCTKKCKENNYLTSLQSNDLSERYAAAKALSYFDSKKSEAALLSSMNNQSEHIYVRLESAASLLKRGITESLRFFADILKDTYLENRLECVIILGEIKKPESCDLLISTLLDNSQHPEIRAGAAWSLGESMNKKALSVLVKAFNDVELEVRAEAARAMNKLNTNFIKDTIKLFSQSDETARAGIAWSISKSGNFKIEDLSGMLADPEARKWLAWIIGTQDEEKYIHEIEGLRERDKEVYFAVTVLWKIMSSWIDGLDLY
jgi:HEAT repeat protein